MTENRGRVVALPESRQLDVLARLLEKRGLAVHRCPMIGIADSPNPEVVEDWIRRQIERPADIFIVYTGEGVDRLIVAAQRAGISDPFVESLGRSQLLTRGPKPVQALRRLGLKPTHQAIRATTNGVLESLDGLEIEGLTVAVQLYGGEPNTALEAYLEGRRAEIDCVAPYVYVPAANDDEVHALIDDIRSGGVDAIAFTSKTQVQRLMTVAADAGVDRELNLSWQRLVVAAIGPVAARAVEAYGLEVDVMPEGDFFMKPLVTRLSECLDSSG